MGEEWTASLTLPAGQCMLEVFVLDAGGEVICDGNDVVAILPDELTNITAVLTCDV